MSDVTLWWAKAGQGFFLGIESGNQVEQAQDVEGNQCPAGRAYEPQIAALPSQRDTDLDDDAKAGTIHVGEVDEIQQDISGPAGNQLFQPVSQQLALTIADGGPALEVQDGDVAGFTN